MTILNRYLSENCTEEQSSLLIKCFEVLTKIGLVEIQFNIDELLGNIETDDLFTTIQKCYQKIRTFQNLAFDELELEVNNFDDIGSASDLLHYLDQLEDSDSHEQICSIIENNPNAEDTLFELLEKVVFADITSILHIVEYVPSSLIDRLFHVHQSDESLIEISDNPVNPIDERKLKILNNLWNKKDINFLRSDILNDQLNLPISNEYWKVRSVEGIKVLRSANDKSRIAVKLLEGCLVLDVEWKDIKKTMRELAKEIFPNDTLFIAELSYFIDNICMEFNINESL